MYFYVFLEPEIFEEAATDGEDAAQNIATILNGFLQNCFLMVFEDDHWASLVKEKLEKWPETMTRKRVTSLLVRLKKHNRLLYYLIPDYSGMKSDIDCVFEQADSVSLDLILVIMANAGRPIPKGVEIATRQTYQNSIFEPKRSNLAVYGSTCNTGDMDETKFMKFHFEKALKYASIINICDRVCGRRNFADNFRYTTLCFIKWLGSVLNDPSRCKIIFHLGQPEGQGEQFIIHELASLKHGILNSTVIEVYFYDESLPDPNLPHQRFIMTDQVALDIDRGLDFLDERTHRCRDNFVSYQDPQAVERLLQSYSSNRMPVQRILVHL